MEYINIKDVFLASDSEKVALLTKNFLSDLNNKFNLPSEALSEAANRLYTTQDPKYPKTNLQISD